MILACIGLAVFGGDGGDVAGGGVEADVELIGKGWAALDEMVANELEVFALREYGGLVVEGAVAEAKGEMAGDAAAATDLGDISDGDDVIVGIFEGEEAVEGALIMAHRDGVGYEWDR